MTQALLTIKVDGNPFLDGCEDAARITLDWVSATTGTVSFGIASTLAAANLSASGNNSASIQPNAVKGVIRRIQTIPGLLGDKTTALPTAYDVTLLDAYGMDAAGGKLGARSAAVAEVVDFTPQVVVDSELTLTIANAGDTKKGRIIIDLSEVEV